MPSVSVASIILALEAIIATVFFGATGVAAVGFANGYNSGFQGTSFPAAVLYQPVQFRPAVSAAPCHTCLHIHSDHADTQQLWNIRPSQTIPLKISYAAPYTHSKPTPTPPPITYEATSAPASSFISKVIAPPRGASTLAASSMVCQNMVRNLANVILTLASSLPWVMIHKITWLLSLMAALVYIPRPNFFERCRQLPIKTIEMVGKVMAIILLGFHKPEMLLSMATYKARSNGIPNLDIRRPQKAHADNMTFYEQYPFATADIGPSFGPSIQNAETEFRSLLERVEGNMGKQTDIIAYFRKTLDSFARALAVAEATPEGCNTHYLTVIQDQDRLIDELRMLHEYREQAFRELEDTIETLCRSNDDQNLPNRSDKYSIEYDKFIIRARQDPPTLSMAVSVKSVPFHRRPVSILDSDPNWQRFLELTAEKGSEQEARLAHEENLNEWDEEEEEDACKWDEEKGEDIEDGCVLGDTGVNDAEPPNEERELAQSNLAWFEWKLACMKGSQGTPGGSDSKWYSGSDIPPATALAVTEDNAFARQAQEIMWAEYPTQLAIADCKLKIKEVKEEIACMASNATSEGSIRRGRKGEVLAKPTNAGDSSLSRIGPKPSQGSK